MDSKHEKKIQARPQAKSQPPTKKQKPNPPAPRLPRAPKRPRALITRKVEDSDLSPDEKALKRFIRSNLSEEITNKSLRALHQMLAPERAPLVPFSDGGIQRKALISTPYEQIYTVGVSGEFALYFRADMYSIANTYTDCAGGGSAPITNPDSVGIAATYTEARCTGLCARITVNYSMLNKAPDAVYVPIYKHSSDYTASLISSFAAAAKTPTAVKWSPRPAQAYCCRAVPQNYGVMQGTESVAGGRTQAALWGGYFAITGLTSGDKISVSTMYVFEAVNKANYVMTIEDNSGVDDAEVIIPIASDRKKFPLVREVNVGTVKGVEQQVARFSF